VDECKPLFSGIGIIARVRQKTGFPDQWPFNVKIYKDDFGKLKNEAGGFFTSSTRPTFNRQSELQLAHLYEYNHAEGESCSDLSSRACCSG